MSDAQRELHQRSLTNVRALLDKEQREIELARKNERLMIWIALPVILFFVGLAWFAVTRPDRREPVDLKQAACEAKLFNVRSRAAERTMRAANPGISDDDATRELLSRRDALVRAVKQECRTRLRP
jgi:hypothetical protein